MGINFIKEEIKEGQLLPSLVSTLEEHGWRVEGEFWKVIVADRIYKKPNGKNLHSDKAFFTKSSDFTTNLSSHEGFARTKLAKHYIVSPPVGGMFYGFAVEGEYFLVSPSDVGDDNWVGQSAIVKDVVLEAQEFVKQIEFDPELFQRYVDKVVEVYSDDPLNIDYNKIYFYMTKEKPLVKDHGMFYLNDKEQVAIDVEVQWSSALWTGRGTSVINDTSSYSEGVIEYANPDVLQSPISVVRTRSIEIGHDLSLSEKYPINNTNWHSDSVFDVVGYVAKNSAFFTIQADSSAAYGNNITPSVPLFLGQFTPLDDNDDRNYAIIAGSAFKTDDPAYDFDDPEPFDEKPLQPILKNYVSNPSNGVDNVTVLRTKGGAYYQAHHLFVEVSPNDVEPPRVHDNRKYPSAWSQADALAYNYQMNPSRYSGEVHASRIYIAHMDEGVRGYLDGLIATNPLSLLDGDTLKVKVDWCEDGYDEYEYKVLSSVSPFTKYPSTPFRPLGLGIIKSKYEEDK